MSLVELLGWVCASLVFRIVGIILLITSAGLPMTILALIVYSIGPAVMWWAVFSFMSASNPHRKDFS